LQVKKRVWRCCIRIAKSTTDIFVYPENWILRQFS
jgi:hypothetical protein